MGEITAAEALVRALDIAVVSEEALSSLRALGFAVVPVVPAEATVERGARRLAFLELSEDDAETDEKLWLPAYKEMAKETYAAMVAPDTEKGKT